MNEHNYTEASAYLTQAITVDPDNYAANYGLLLLYARTDDSRRDQQTKRFEEVKGKRDASELEMTRLFEIHPDGSSNRR